MDSQRGECIMVDNDISVFFVTLSFEHRNILKARIPPEMGPHKKCDDCLSILILLSNEIFGSKCIIMAFKLVFFEQFFLHKFSDGSTIKGSRRKEEASLQIL